MLFSLAAGESVLFSLSLSLVGWFPGYHQEGERRVHSVWRMWRVGIDRSVESGEEERKSRLTQLPPPQSTTSNSCTLSVCVYIICSLRGVVGCTIPLFSLFFCFSFLFETRERKGYGQSTSTLIFAKCYYTASYCVCVYIYAPLKSSLSLSLSLFLFPFRPSSPLSLTLTTFFLSFFYFIFFFLLPPDDGNG